MVQQVLHFILYLTISVISLVPSVLTLLHGSWCFWAESQMIIHRFLLQEGKSFLNVAPVLKHSSASLPTLQNTKQTVARLVRWTVGCWVGCSEPKREETHHTLAAHHLQQVQQPGAIPEVIEQIHDHAGWPPLPQHTNTNTLYVTFINICIKIDGEICVKRVSDRIQRGLGWRTTSLWHRIRTN